jgi:DNA-binding transcriptional LysR family regulator
LGGLYAWEFGKDGRELNVRVDGQLVFNEMSMILKAATEGFGLAFVLEDKAAPLIADGRLDRVLADWRRSEDGAPGWKDPRTDRACGRHQSSLRRMYRGPYRIRPKAWRDQR